MTSLITSAASSYDSAMMQANAAKTAAMQDTAKSAIEPGKMKDIEKAAKEFEGMFVSEMLGHMFENIDVDPAFGGGKGEEMFRGLLVQEYGKKIAEGPGIGIADHVKRAMIQMQSNLIQGE